MNAANTYNLLKTLINHFDFAAIIAAIISILASVYIFKTTPKYDLVYQRYITLISPLFDLVEPQLFKSVNKEFLDKVLFLISSNKSLAGGKLLHHLYFCEVNPSQENYNALCSCINHEYDKCCARLGLGKRTIWYKIVRKQYKNKFVFVLYMLLQTVLFSTILLSFVIVLFFTFHLIGNAIGIEILPLTK